ncbi:MAG: protein kinase [Anaerolineales bacterium]|nr:serine/threonine-protein kinase [Anaerolineales bacterium]MDW8446286.1 protein kinase [Anaerolineales bacterium]
MVLERGTLVNSRYRVIEVLGQGGMGAVYRAIDENLGVEVALKENLFTTEEYARQFHREAVILANLRHPNLPRVTDHFIIEGQGQYLVMDYIEGEDLRERMERLGVISEEEAVQIGVALCDALSYLSSRTEPVVHRDIKPGNVKITPDGHIYLVDFGLAKVLEGYQETTTGARAMTPGYSPPEQYGTARTDHRSDIYSLGATLYAAVTGHLPEDALARLIGQAQLTKVRVRNPKISEAFAAVIEKALEVKPEDRFANAQQFREALLESQRIRQQALSPGRSQSSPTLPERTRPAGWDSVFEIPAVLMRRHWLNMPLWVWLASALAISALGVWFSSRQGLSPTPVFAPVPTATGGKLLSLSSPTALLEVSHAPPVPTATKMPTPSPTPLRSPPTDSGAASVNPLTPTVTPTAFGGGVGQIAFASNRSGSNQIWLMSLDGSGLTQLTNIPEGACQPRFAPDGLKLIFISPCPEESESYPGAGMFLINVDGTGLTPLPNVPGGDYDPAWSPDGNWLAFTSMRITNRPRIYLMDLRTLEVKRLSEEFSRDYQPAWSADGKRIVFVSRRQGPTDLWVMNADGSEQERLTLSGVKISASPSWSPDGKLIAFTQSPRPGGVPRLAMFSSVEGKTVEYGFDLGPMPVRDPVFSPDGLWLLFTSWPDGRNHDIYMIAVNGAARTQLTDFPSKEFDPAWRPQVASPIR